MWNDPIVTKIMAQPNDFFFQTKWLSDRNAQRKTTVESDEGQGWNHGSETEFNIGIPLPIYTTASFRDRPSFERHSLDGSPRLRFDSKISSCRQGQVLVSVFQIGYLRAAVGQSIKKTWSEDFDWMWNGIRSPCTYLPYLSCLGNKLF